MSDVTNYHQHWEDIYRRAYAAGRRHWRAKWATPPVFADFMASPWMPAKGGRIVEAGCGDGLNAIHLARAGYDARVVLPRPDARGVRSPRGQARGEHRSGMGRDHRCPEARTGQLRTIARGA